MKTKTPKENVTTNGLRATNEVRFTTSEAAARYDCDFTEVYRIAKVFRPSEVVPAHDYVILWRLNGHRMGFVNPDFLRKVELEEFAAYEDSENEPAIVAMCMGTNVQHPCAYYAGEDTGTLDKESGTVTCKGKAQALVMTRCEARTLVLKLNQHGGLHTAIHHWKWLPDVTSESPAIEPAPAPEVYASVGKGRMVKLDPVTKGAALLAIATVMIREEVSAAAACDNSYDEKRTAIMVANGVDGADAVNLLEVDIDTLTEG